jgi:DNA-binding transcriptional LysR family regulator
MDRFQVVESFVRVAQSGSFTKAAMQLGLSRAMMSRRIMDLEARLGVRLLNRSTRKVSLTAEGSAYLARCERVLNDLETRGRTWRQCPARHDQGPGAQIIWGRPLVGCDDRVLRGASADPRFAVPQ